MKKLLFMAILMGIFSTSSFAQQETPQVSHKHHKHMVRKENKMDKKASKMKPNKMRKKEDKMDQKEEKMEKEEKMN